MKRKLNTFSDCFKGLSFGDYILFQEYKEWGWDVGTNQYHIEWDDFVDIIGIWKYKPNWKEIRSG